MVRTLVLDSQRVLLRNATRDLCPPGHDFTVFCDEQAFDLENPTFLEITARAFDEVVPIPDFHRNYQVEAEAIRRHGKAPFDRIVGISEFDLLRAARLRKHFSLDGATPEQTLSYRDKLVMKSTARRAGLDVPSGQRLSSLFDLLEHMRLWGYPLVIKPIRGSGGIQTSILQNNEELSAWIAENMAAVDTQNAGDLLVENFVDGTMCHVDGFILNDTIEPVSVCKYIGDGLSFLRQECHGSVILEGSHPLRAPLIDRIARFVREAPLPGRHAFHAECFVVASGDIVLCEIGARVAGGAISRMITLACGVHMQRSVLWEKAMPDPTLPAPRGAQDDDSVIGWVGIPPKHDHVMTGPFASDMPELLESDVLIEPDTVMTQGRWCCDHIAEFIVAGSTSKVVEDRLGDVVQSFDSLLQPVVAKPAPALSTAASGQRINSLCCT